MLMLGHFKHGQMQQIRKLPGNTADGLKTLFLWPTSRRQPMDDILMTIARNAFTGSLFLCFLAHAQLPPKAPIPRDGSCPSGYVTQGNFCAPGAGAQLAIPKHGSCPSGYASEGNYCVANPNAKAAFLKHSAMCPYGYVGQGNYCVYKN
jgi:hypothetical protein